MIKQYFALCALCLMACLAFAQEKLSIQVIDERANPIVGVTVSIGNITQTTNTRGMTTFPKVTGASQTVKASYLGYETASQVIPAGQSTLNLILKPAMHQTGEVFVQSTRARENGPTTFSNISKEELRKTNLGQDIPFLLDQTPGVVVSSDAGAGIGYTSMRIRGSDNERINVTLNGIPLNDAESMGSFFVNLPDFASSVESIQVQRGIGTSTNGAGAFGASVNIQTDVLETQPYAELNNSYGSFNSWKNTVKVGSGLLKNKYAFNARLSRIATDGYVERASANMQSFYLDGGVYTQKHTLKATLFSGKQTTYQAWYGTPEPLLTGNREELPAYADAMEIFDETERQRLFNADRRYNFYTYDGQTDNYQQTHAHLQYSFTPNDKVSIQSALHYTRGAGYFEEFRADDRLSRYNLPNVIHGTDTISRTDLVRQRWLDNHFYGVTYAANYKVSNDLRFTVGGAYNEYIGDHFGEVIWARYASTGNLGDRYYFNDAKKTDFNIYGKADYRKDDWLLNADLQYRIINYRAEGPDQRAVYLDFRDNLHFFNPKFGTTYFINESANVYGSYAYASKEPVRKDYAENPLNEFPRPERMHNVELGYRLRESNFNLGVNAYAMLYKDQLIATGALNDVGGSIRQNVPDSYRAGVEFDGAWIISPQFEWRATAALSTNKIRNFVEYIAIYDADWNMAGQQVNTYDKTDIALSPSTVLSSDFTYRPMEPLALSLTSKYVSRMYLDNTSSLDRSIDPSFVNNLRALYTLSAWGLERVDLNLAVNNVLNTKFATNGYTWGSIDPSGTHNFYNFYFPQATINFLLGLNIRF
ncbi:TonB-dependent receptor [Sphingobacterium sp. lm-10]|uniref:TonB-dependent receptor n=1 Tax=Sphingobacterium sp. lm-10 TaxID=2944904 RepID=UPI002021D877|nr:TonB-dependent receptor [Sphingobacterium sp. lm-10]MCL7988670.1 TonB-dependent receptor [Sphingobacterium sp. lm-10]